MLKMFAILISIALVVVIVIEGVWTYQMSDIMHMTDNERRLAFDEHINRIKAGESMADMCDDARQALRLIDNFYYKTKAEWGYQNDLEIAVKSRECN